MFIINRDTNNWISWIENDKNNEVKFKPSVWRLTLYAFVKEDLWYMNLKGRKYVRKKNSLTCYNQLHYFRIYILNIFYFKIDFLHILLYFPNQWSSDQSFVNSFIMNKGIFKKNRLFFICSRKLIIHLVLKLSTISSNTLRGSETVQNTKVLATVWKNSL